MLKIVTSSFVSVFLRCEFQFAMESAHKHWIFLICYDLVTAEVYVFSGAMFIILFVSLCYHHRAFFKIFQHSLHTFDRSDEARNDEILLFQLIRFHVTIKE